MLIGEEPPNGHTLALTDVHFPVTPHDKRPINILIAVSHAIFRDGLRALLQMEHGFHVVGEAPDGEAAVRLATQIKPDILLLDMMIPKRNGLDVLRQLRRLDLPVRVLALAGDAGKDMSMQALNLGARGVILNTSQSATLYEAIRKVMAGEYWVSPENVASLVERLKNTTQRASAPNPRFGLTPRELEIVVAVVSGYSNPEIAEKLALSEQTVKHHLTHVFDKLGVYSRVELALFAVNHNLVDN
jgi:DNA-binding NarL/FixJ family response regulator